MKQNAFVQNIRKYISTDHLGLDIRSLALFRVLVGILIFTDILGRFPDIEHFYTENGLMPFQLGVKNQFPFYSVLNIHQFFDSLTGIRILFLIHMAGAISLMLGFKTRLASVVCWFLQVSLHSQNSLIQNSGDVFLRDALFWLPFLPLAEAWALDKKRDVEKTFSRIQSWATWGFILQIFWMYFATALQKNHSSWWPNGTAGETALYVEAFTLPLGVLARDLPSWILKVGTLCVYVWELLACFFLVLPVFQAKLRFVGMVGFLFLHIFLVSTVSLGHFQWNVLACLLVLLPSFFWDFLEKKKLLLTKRGSQELRFSFSLKKSSNLILFFLVAIMSIRNLVTVPQLKNWFRHPAFSHLIKCTNFLRFEHNWNLFAPHPIRNNGWYEIEATLKNGNKIWIPPHPYTSAAKDGVKPDSLLNHYGPQRWKDYYFYIFRDAYKNTWPYLKNYHCHRAQLNGNELSSLKISYLYQMLQFGNERESVRSTPLKRVLIEGECIKTIN